MCGVQMVIKCADIGHLAADHNTHKRWSYKLEEEFFRQVQPPQLTRSSWHILHEEATPALWCQVLTMLCLLAVCSGACLLNSLSIHATYASTDSFCTQQHICAYCLLYALACAKLN